MDIKTADCVMIALTEEQAEILLQALSARDNQLRYHTHDSDCRRVALPVVQAIKAKVGDGLTSLWVRNRQSYGF